MIKISVIGKHHVPNSGPVVLVSNHRSVYDPLIISSVISRRIIWIVASYLKHVPFVGWAIKNAGMVFVNLEGKSSSSSKEKALKALDRNEIIGVFPEGDKYLLKNEFSSEMEPFYEGLATLALHENVVLLPTVLLSVKEKKKKITVPKRIRKKINSRHHLPKPMFIVRYKEVKYIIGKPIKVSALETTCKQEIIRITRERMYELQKENTIVKNEIVV